MLPKLYEHVSNLSEAANLLTKTASVKASNFVIVRDQCGMCSRISSVGSVTGLAYKNKLVPCVCCTNKICSECRKLSVNAIPKEFWNENIPKSKDLIGYLCKTCQEKCIKVWMISLIEKYATTYYDSLEKYLITGEVESLQKPKPTVDTSSYKAFRLGMMVTNAASMLYPWLKGVKLIIENSSVLAILLSKDVIKMLQPIIMALKEFQMTSSADIVSLYYLGCNYELQRRQNFDLESALHRNGDIGVIAEMCPADIIHDLALYSGPAQWLYLALLPYPHEDHAWASWYLSRMVLSEGWRLIASQMDSVQLPDGSICPAFALVAREDGGVGKKALLVVRGSKSATDWKINMREGREEFVYRSGATGGDPVAVSCHRGMYVGAKAILDVFGIRQCLHRLLDAGYDIKVVGHSLGAGTTALLVALIKNGLYERAMHYQQQQQHQQQQVHLQHGGGEEGGKEEKSELVVQEDFLNDLSSSFAQSPSRQQQRNGTGVGDTGNGNEKGIFGGNGNGIGAGDSEVPLLPVVKGYGYGIPPCTDEALAQALIADELMTSMIHRDDLIPRMTASNAMKLATEIKAFHAQADKWRQMDQESLMQYAKSCGRAGDMAFTSRGGAEGGGGDVRLEEEAPSAVEETKGEGGDEGGGDEERGGESSDGKRDAARTLCVPGRIVHFAMREGVYSATLSDYRLASLNSITPVLACLEHHEMPRYIDALRIYISPVAKQSPKWQPCYLPSTKEWACCSVCQSDPTWPYITKGDPSRAIVYHNCRSCGRVVCSICAQAADSIPGSAIGDVTTLSDNRISLPEFGMINPVRVCIDCYLHSSVKGLGGGWD